MISTVVLARLLAPADFGIVGMAMFFVGLLELLNQTGQKLMIIRHENPLREDYDTAWTLSLIGGVIVGCAIFALAPVAKMYFHEPRVVPVMQFLALRSALGGLENIGPTDFRRDMHFDRFFIYGVIPKLLSLPVTIGLAVILRNYWALVAGILTMQLASGVLSYVMHPYRPRFSLAKYRQMRAFSFWTLFRTVGYYLSLQIDRLIIGGISGAAAMGRYAVAFDLASSPSQEINDPLVAALYPVMSAVRSDTEQLRATYLQAIRWSALICISTSVGVMLVAHDLVFTVLGPKWADLEPFIGWLAFSAGVLGLSSGAYTVFDALGKPHVGARMQWLRLISLTVCLIPVALMWRRLDFIAEARFAATVILVPSLFVVVGRMLGVSPRQYFESFWRPVMAAAAMAAVVLQMNAYLPFAGLLRLGADVATGALTFSSACLGLWWLSGRPNSAEANLVTYFRTWAAAGS